VRARALYWTVAAKRSWVSTCGLPLRVSSHITTVRASAAASPGGWRTSPPVPGFHTPIVRSMIRSVMRRLALHVSPLSVEDTP
jgi:hypothetical protein